MIEKIKDYTAITIISLYAEYWAITIIKKEGLLEFLCGVVSVAIVLSIIFWVFTRLIDMYIRYEKHF